MSPNVSLCVPDDNKSWWGQSRITSAFFKTQWSWFTPVTVPVVLLMWCRKHWSVHLCDLFCCLKSSAWILVEIFDCCWLRAWFWLTDITSCQHYSHAFHTLVSALSVTHSNTFATTLIYKSIQVNGWSIFDSMVSQQLVVIQLPGADCQRIHYIMRTQENKGNQNQTVTDNSKKHNSWFLTSHFYLPFLGPAVRLHGTHLMANLTY